MLEHVYSNVKLMNTEYVNTRIVKAASFLPDATPYIATEDVMIFLWLLGCFLFASSFDSGMDVIPESIEDAKKNAIKHEVNHARFYMGKAEELLPKWLKEGWRPDVIVVDPPRTGCDDEFLKTVLKIQPKTFVYVSCNPSTLAKDITTLSSKYKVEYIQPVDMFPHTSQIESVTRLVLK